MGSMTYTRAMMIRADAEHEAALNALPPHARRNIERAEQDADT